MTLLRTEDLLWAMSQDTPMEERLVVTPMLIVRGRWAPRQSISA